jgi:hypothetical protein
MLFDFLSDFLTVVNRNYTQLKYFSIRLALKSVIQLSRMRFPALLYTVFLIICQNIINEYMNIRFRPVLMVFAYFCI